MSEWPWPRDHPLIAVMDAAIAKPFSHWEQGWPVAHSPRWAGRGLANELGTRAFGTLQTKPGWPRSLDELEWLMIERGEVP